MNNKPRVCFNCKEKSNDVFEISLSLSKKIPEYKNKALCSECRIYLLTKKFL
jgi:hypothetical protein